ncbi:MAG: CHRD domain-containing protein [Limisphaerales bacterium]
MIIHRIGGGKLAARTIWLALLGVPLLASARDFRVSRLPNGATFSCANCHVSQFGGGARNPFGQAVEAIVRGPANVAFWSSTLAALDSDGDGTANGAELGDPEGDGQATPGARVTNPGNAASRPPDNAAPQVNVEAPADGTAVTAPAVVAVDVTATDTDGTVARVEFFDGERLLGTDVEAPYSLLVDWALGAHAITAKATDNAGATTTSAPVTLTVNAPDATRVTRVVRAGEAVDVDWTAGGGPYVVQGKADLVDPWCATSGVTTGLTARVQARGDLGFYRVVDLAGSQSIPLSVVLAGAFERPAVTTSGSGSGTLRLEGNTLTFSVQYAGLSGPATLAHIHGPASMDVSAGVLINLAPFNGDGFGTSGTLAGSVVVTSEQKALILGGQTYVNIHTDANRPGEIRGQVLPVAMGATLSGAQEAPTPVVTPGRGSGHFSLEGDQLTFVINYSGLPGAATLAHIHGPAAIGASAGVMVDLAPFHNGPLGTSGQFSGTIALTADQLVSVASGLTYVNVHTDANRSGEIRGQILPCVTGLPLAATLSGDAEVPAVATPGTGQAGLRLEGDVLSFDIRYGGLPGPATLAHIHGPAAVGSNAGVMINLAPFHLGPLGTAGGFTGSVVLTPEQKAALKGGLTYVNIHTDANRSGEIRGQVEVVGLP